MYYLCLTWTVNANSLETKQSDDAVAKCKVWDVARGCGVDGRPAADHRGRHCRREVNLVYTGVNPELV